ncbi:hypothetical protein GCM10027271_05690 [Saccharopolyspora gloriosae]|uniref:Uncharacterized protein n=1 Tax=Saccharopolyspora gloriosae TaxID=455344 RepID=A0A840NVE8_9PSEU|nr:hypothetical protein [Saccharopolyspora gloriosae]MBB5072117.1 hypothetical protein [Saccharopolyspora gloriosae]
MPAESEEPEGCWAAFGYQNHVIPVGAVQAVGLCGVMADPADVGPRDGRPTCSVCSVEARSGDHRIVPFPSNE